MIVITKILELEYKEVNSYWRTLTVIRFKLLAFVPTLAGLGVALSHIITQPLEAFAIGLFGFIATLGITFYDPRNSQLYDASINRASVLERKMNFSRRYLFTWDNVPGEDSKSLLEYLKDYHSINLAKSKSKSISKSPDDMIITIVKGKKSAKIKIVTDKKATLEINDGKKRDENFENEEVNVKKGKSKYPYDLSVKIWDKKREIYDKLGGIFNLRPPRSRKFLGITLWHDRALAMVYASALGAWLFIIINSIQNIIMHFPPNKPGTFSLLLPVLLAILLAIVIYKMLPKP